MSHPIPDSALDDRLGFVGTSGSGKTYGAGTGVERILAGGGRVIIPDPLGVWWGMALRADGKTPSIWREQGKLVIFGGEHGDLPISEHAGALIGETAARMTESVILDLSSFGTKAAEVRFMLAFLSALYRHASGDPVHLIFDEADMWAPQQERDKGEAPKLLGMMETVIRRGRVRGFLPWLITQRPAVLNKNVLSMIDGLVSFKLTSSQDRDAIGDWVKGQADVDQWKATRAQLPTMQRGEALTWIPARGICEVAQFPAKTTFDSSRTPERGEKRQRRDLKPLDLGKLKEKLAEVEAETKANDPRALKAEVARLTRELRAAAQPNPKTAPSPQPAWPDQREEVAQLRGQVARLSTAIEGFNDRMSAVWERWKAPIGEIMDAQNELFGTLTEANLRPIGRPNSPGDMTIFDLVERSRPSAPAVQRRPAPAPLREPRQSEAGGPITGPQRRVLNALAWWHAFGIEQPTSEQVAFIAGYSASSSGYANLKGAMRSAGLIDYPVPGRVALTDAGAAEAEPPSGPVTRETFHAAVRAKLSNPQQRLLDPALAAWPEGIAVADLAAAAGYSASSSGFANLRGNMRSLGFIDYPEPGFVRAADWLFPAPGGEG